MLIRKLMVCSGLTLCALAIHTASAQNYQGWSNPGQRGYGGGVPQGMPQMPQGMPWMTQGMPQMMPQMPQGAPQMPQGMPWMRQGMPRMPQAGPAQRYGSSGFQRQQAAPYQNPWPAMSMPNAPGYQSGVGQTRMSGMSGMQGQPGMSGMSGMSGQQGSYGTSYGQFPGRY
jgi:hypothetical protein